MSTPGEPASSRSISKRKWSDIETSTLLTLFQEKFVVLERGNMKPKHWTEIVSEFNKVHVDEAMKRSAENCKNQVQMLRRQFVKERTKEKKTGSAPSSWKHYEMAENIWGKTTKLQGLINGVDAGDLSNPIRLSGSPEIVYQVRPIVTSYENFTPNESFLGLLADDFDIRETDPAIQENLVSALCENKSDSQPILDDAESNVESTPGVEDQRIQEANRV